MQFGWLEVGVSGQGCGMLIGHAQSEPPEIETYTKSGEPNPLDNPPSKAKVLALAHEEVNKLRKAICC